MFKKEIIKSVLLEGSEQISAALPKMDLENPEDKFSFFFPVVLNSSIVIDETTFDSFKVVLYNSEGFESEFSSKINIGNSEKITNNFKNFSVTGLEDPLPQFQKNISNNFYFDKNVVTESYNINFDINLVETFLDQKIYKIGFTNAQSKVMKNSSFKCFRIFCIKDNNIVYDTDVIIFSSVDFLKDVFENRKVFDFNFFVNTFYLKDFQDILNLRSARRSLFVPDIVIKIVTSNQIDFSIAQGDVEFTLEYKRPSVSKILTKNISLSNLSGLTIMSNDNRFFEKITEDFVINKIIFQFTLTCTIKFENSDIDKVYTKDLFFRRNDSFIRNIVDFSKRSFNQSAFDSLGLSVKQNLLETSGNLFLSADSNLISRDILKSFEISNIFQNETSIIDNLYTRDTIDINSFTSLNRKTLFDIFDSTNSVRLHFRNDQTKIKSKIRVEIKSVLSKEFLKYIETDSILNRPNLTNAFSDINKLFKRNIIVSDKEIDLIDLSDRDFINRYNTIQIVNLEVFKNIASNFGYNTNDSVRGNIIDFLSSCVFSIEVHERIDGINDTDFKFKDYFFGEEILDIESLNDNSNNVFFLQSFLDKISFNIEQLTKSLSNSNKDLANIKNILNQDLAARTENILFVKNFIENTNIAIVKNIKIAIIPIQKQIQEHRSIGIDELGNIAFDNDTPTATKNSVDPQFVNMFYDTNSSLNWGIFNKFKNTYFYKPGQSKVVQLLIPSATINNTTISFAKTYYPIWDYLSSNLYILNSEIFNNTSIVDKNNFLETFPGIENDFNNFSKVIKNYHFQDFGSEHFNFSDQDNLITVSDIGLSYRVSDFINNDISMPQKINFVKNSELNSLSFSFDITSLKIRHALDDINSNSEMFLKYSIHPLILQESSIDFTNSGFYPSLIGDENSYITQNNFYMTTINKDYFKDYNIAINKSSMEIKNLGSKLILKTYIDNENKIIDSSTFRDLLDFCIQNNSTVLKDFIARFTISVKINDFYYVFNLHEVIPRINLQNTEIKINNIRSIKI